MGIPDGWVMTARGCSNICTSTRKTCHHKPYIVAEVPRIKLLHLIIDSTVQLCVHMNVQNMLLMFPSLVCSWTVEATGYCLYAGVPLRQYRACGGMSSEWKYICCCIT